MHLDYRYAFDRAPIAMVVSQRREIADCNEQMCVLFGADKDALVGQSLEILYPSHRDFEQRGERILAGLDTEGRYADVRLMRRVAGSDSEGLFWCHVSGRAMIQARPHESGIWTFEDATSGSALSMPADLPLTRRERQVAAMLLTGSSSQVIADELGLSRRTVEVYRGSLLRKHDVHTTAELIALLVDA